VKANAAPPNGVAPVQGLMKERAYAEIKQRILDCVYPPGSFLAERSLASALGMSKTPVKAALERLEHEGFIIVSPQQGIVVRELSIHEITDQYEIRMALESFTLRLLAGNLTADQVERVRANLDAQFRGRNRGDVPSAVRLDAEFHFQFAEFLGNQEILRVVSRLKERMHRIITSVFQKDVNRARASYDEHKQIADAVIRGDGVRAAALIEKHLETGKQLIVSPSLVRRMPG
jgi:DNA-binding GntR family transcriptional regulator